MIQIRPLAVSYDLTVLKGTNVKCLDIHPVVKLQRFLTKMSVGHTSIAPENAECL